MQKQFRHFLNIYTAKAIYALLTHFCCFFIGDLPLAKGAGVNRSHFSRQKPTRLELKIIEQNQQELDKSTPICWIWFGWNFRPATIGLAVLYIRPLRR